MKQIELLIITAVISLFFTFGAGLLLPDYDNKKTKIRKRFGLGFVFAAIWWTYLVWLL